MNPFEGLVSSQVALSRMGLTEKSPYCSSFRKVADKLGLEIIEGPAFGRGRVLMVRATDVDRIGLKAADLLEGKLSQQRSLLNTNLAGNNGANAHVRHKARLSRMEAQLTLIIKYLEQLGCGKTNGSG